MFVLREKVDRPWADSFRDDDVEELTGRDLDLPLERELSEVV